MESKELLINGMNNYIKRIRRCEKIYLDVLESIPKNFKGTIYKIQDKKLFNKIILNFVAALDQKKLKAI